MVLSFKSGITPTSLGSSKLFWISIGGTSADIPDQKIQSQLEGEARRSSANIRSSTPWLDPQRDVDPIELKPLPSGLRYVFLHNNRKTLVIISDKLSDYKTQQLVTVLERHLATLSKISRASAPFSALIVSLLIPILHLQGNHNGDLTMLCERLLRMRSSNSIMLGVFILCHIVSGLALSK